MICMSNQTWLVVQYPAGTVELAVNSVLVKSSMSDSWLSFAMGHSALVLSPSSGPTVIEDPLANTLGGARLERHANRRVGERVARANLRRLHIPRAVSRNFHFEITVSENNVVWCERVRQGSATDCIIADIETALSVRSSLGSVQVL